MGKSKSKKAAARARRAATPPTAVPPTSTPVPPTAEPTAEATVKATVEVAAPPSEATVETPIVQTATETPAPTRVVAWLTRHAPTAAQEAWWAERGVTIKFSPAFAAGGWSFRGGAEVSTFAADAAAGEALVAVVSVLPMPMLPDALRSMGETPLLRAVMERRVEPDAQEKTTFSWAGTWERILKVAVETAPFDLELPPPAPETPPPAPTDPAPTDPDPDPDPTPPPSGGDTPAEATEAVPPAPAPAPAPEPQAAVETPTPPTPAPDAPPTPALTRQAFERLTDAEKIAAMKAAGAFAERPEDATAERPFLGVMRIPAGKPFGFVGEVFVPPSLANPAYNVGAKLENGAPILIERVERTEKGLRALSASHGGMVDILFRRFAETLPDGISTPRPYTGEIVAVPDVRTHRLESYAAGDAMHCTRRYSPLPYKAPVTHVPSVWTGDLHDYVIMQHDVAHVDGDWTTWRSSDKIAGEFLIRTFVSETVVKHFQNVMFGGEETEEITAWVTCALPLAAAAALGVPLTLESAMAAYAGKPVSLWRWLVSANVRRADVPRELRPRLADALGATWDADFPHRFSFPAESALESLVLEQNRVATLYMRDPDYQNGCREVRSVAEVEPEPTDPTPPAPEPTPPPAPTDPAPTDPAPTDPAPPPPTDIPTLTPTPSPFGRRPGEAVSAPAAPAAPASIFSKRNAALPRQKNPTPEELEWESPYEIGEIDNPELAEELRAGQSAGRIKVNPQGFGFVGSVFVPASLIRNQGLKHNTYCVVTKTTKTDRGERAVEIKSLGEFLSPMNIRNRKERRGAPSELRLQWLARHEPSIAAQVLRALGAKETPKGWSVLPAKIGGQILFEAEELPLETAARLVSSTLCETTADELRVEYSTAQDRIDHLKGWVIEPADITNVNYPWYNAYQFTRRYTPVKSFPQMRADKNAVPNGYCLTETDEGVTLNRVTGATVRFKKEEYTVGARRLQECLKELARSVESAEIEVEPPAIEIAAVVAGDGEPVNWLRFRTIIVDDGREGGSWTEEAYTVTVPGVTVTDTPVATPLGWAVKRKTGWAIIAYTEEMNGTDA